MADILTFNNSWLRVGTAVLDSGEPVTPETQPDASEPDQPAPAST